MDNKLKKTSTNLKKKNPYNVSYENYMETMASDTECTGLIPNGDKNRLDYERYKEIYHFGGDE